MSSPVTSPEDVVNLALARFGYATRVTNLYDGSAASSAALDVYGQTRDALLRQNDWGFAERNLALDLLKSAPSIPGGYGYVPPNTWNPATNPPLPWLFSYAYPADCLKVRAVKAQVLFVPNFDPQPNLFGVENDNTRNPPAKVILCNVPAALLIYTGQVTDPTTWEADFVDALADALGRALAPVLKDLKAAQLEAMSGAETKQIAEANQG